MSNTLKNLIIALGITLLAGGAYMFTMGGASEEEMLYDSGVSGTSDIGIRNQKILRDTQEISAYDLDVSFFEDSRFISLQNHHVDVPDTVTGRINPFAPI